MSKYKIHIDKSLPDSEQVKRHQDFERLYGRYESATRFGFWRRLLRKPRLFGSVVLLGIVLWLVFDAGKKGKQPPFIDPQLSYHQEISTTESCNFQWLLGLWTFYDRGIPMTWETAEGRFYLKAQIGFLTQACTKLPISDSDSLFSHSQWYKLDTVARKWTPYPDVFASPGESVLATGTIHPWPDEEPQSIRLLTFTSGENLSRKLGRKDRRAFMIWHEQSTIIPLAYDGEGKHILPFMPEGKVFIWAVDDEGTWWEADDLAFKNWQNSGSIYIIAKKTDADKRVLGK